MSDFKKFAQSAKPTSQTDLLRLLKDTLFAGIEEFSKTIGHMFDAPDKAGKHQIPRELDQREQDLKQERKGT